MSSPQSTPTRNRPYPLGGGGIYGAHPCVPQGKPRFALALAIFALFTQAAAFSQSELRPSTVGERFDPITVPDEPVYNLKLGAFKFRAQASLKNEYTDNVNLSSTAPQSDEIVTPSLSIGMFWQPTAFNSVRLNTTIGYMWYVTKPNQEGANSSVIISPDSSVDYDIYIGHFVINVHDRFSFQQDPITEPSLSNVTQYGRFINTIGLQVAWNMNPTTTLTTSYDHTNLIPDQSLFAFQEYSEDQLSFSANIGITSAFAGGLEGSIASTRYRTGEKPDALSTHIGPFFDYDLTDFTQFRLAGGYQNISMNGSSGPSLVATNGVNGLTLVNNTSSSQGGQSSYYFNAEISNQLTNRIKQALRAGRESSLGVTTSAVEEVFFEYKAGWEVNDFLNIQANLFVNRGNELGGPAPERYTQFGGGLNASIKLGKNLNAGLGYRFVRKDSNLPLQSYSQNLVSLSFDYSF